jgi:hypothetical protein
MRFDRFLKRGPTLGPSFVCGDDDALLGRIDQDNWQFAQVDFRVVSFSVSCLFPFFSFSYFLPFSWNALCSGWLTWRNRWCTTVTMAWEGSIWVIETIVFVYDFWWYITTPFRLTNRFLANWNKKKLAFFLSNTMMLSNYLDI